MGNKIRVCPRCGSTKLNEVRTSISGWLTPSTYHCGVCDYSGPVYVEVEAEELERLQRAMNGE